MNATTPNEGTQARLKSFTSMDRKEVFSEPSKVEAVDGDVALDGPDGLDVALTPEAAEETSNRLLEEAARPQRQRYKRDNKQ